MSSYYESFEQQQELRRQLGLPTDDEMTRHEGAMSKLMDAIEDAICEQFGEGVWAEEDQLPNTRAVLGALLSQFRFYQEDLFNLTLKRPQAEVELFDQEAVEVV